MLNTLAMLRAISCSICRVHRCILNAIMYFCKLLIFICDFLCNTKSLTEVCLLTRGQWISNNCNVFITMRLHIWPDYWDLKCHQTLWTSGPFQKRVGLEKLIELETMMRCALAPTGCRQQHSVSVLENVKMFFLCILFYVAICVETVLTIPWRELSCISELETLNTAQGQGLSLETLKSDNNLQLCHKNVRKYWDRGDNTGPGSGRGQLPSQRSSLQSIQNIPSSVYILFTQSVWEYCHQVSLICTFWHLLASKWR